MPLLSEAVLVVGIVYNILFTEHSAQLAASHSIRFSMDLFRSKLLVTTLILAAVIRGCVGDGKAL